MIEEELQQLEQLEFLLALATPDTFPALLLQLLVPLLSSLNSPSNIIHQKVMSVCSHVSKRVKAGKEIQLPMDGLVGLYGSGGMRVKMFTLIYIEIGLPRLSQPAQLHIVSELLPGISQAHENVATSIFSFLLGVIGYYEDITSPLKNVGGCSDVGYLLSKFRLVLLYRTPVLGTVVGTNGLRDGEISFITNKSKQGFTGNTEVLGNVKVSILKFLLHHSTVGTKEYISEKYILHLIASSDGNDRVQAMGVEGLKRFDKPNFESIGIIDELFWLYREGGNLIRCKVIEVLSRSTIAGRRLIECVDLICDGFLAEGQFKLKVHLLGLAQWVIKVNDTVSESSKLLQVVFECLKEQKFKGFGYELLGVLVQKVPASISGDVSILRQLFQSLERENSSIQSSILESLKGVLQGYLGNENILQVLEEYQSSESAEVRLGLLRVGNGSLSFDCVRMRRLCLALSVDSSLSVREEALKGLTVVDFRVPEGMLFDMLAVLKGVPSTPSTLPFLHSLLHLIPFTLTPPSFSLSKRNSLRLRFPSIKGINEYLCYPNNTEVLEVVCAAGLDFVKAYKGGGGSHLRGLVDASNSTPLGDTIDYWHYFLAYSSYLNLPCPNSYVKEIEKCLESEHTESFTTFIVFTPIPASLQAKLLTLITTLEDTIKTSKDIKKVEASLILLSYTTIQNDKVRERVRLFLIALNSEFNVETQFVVGEALAVTLFGFLSTSLQKYLTLPIQTPLTSLERVEYGLEGVREVLKGGNQSNTIRKNTTIHLLVFTTLLTSTLTPLLTDLHSAFSTLLSSKDDFTQDLASKGIGLIYELGSPSVKKELVQALVGTFTEGKKIQAQSVTGDTVLFAGSGIGEHEGGSLNTYKSILSLAADMNQPDLVYKFMSLASHHSIWNSRRGASMGFASIAKQAEEELRPFLADLVPLLYRYQFDPHPGTSSGMKAIWASLVKEPGVTIKKYYEAILKGILRGMSDRAWRTREGSCVALTDLLHTTQIEQIEATFQETWTMSFRVMDDIKESVRKAAFGVLKALTRLTVLYCTDEFGRRGKALGSDMVPFLLLKGLPSTSQEVRAFSLKTLLELCKTGKGALETHLTLLIVTFLETLSVMEASEVGYASFHTERLGVTKEELDQARLMSTKVSPLTSALDSIVKYISNNTLVELMPQLIGLVRKVVGLPSKVGVARFIVTLSVSMSMEVRPYADQLLNALTGGLRDPSEVVRKVYATALGYVCRLSTPHAILSLTDKMVALFKSDQDSVASVVFLEMVTQSPSNLPLHLILPVAFLFQSVNGTMKKVWNETIGGTTTGIRTYQREIYTLSVSLLQESQSWVLKASIGKGLQALGEGLCEESVGLFPDVVAVFGLALEGRCWAGKEELVWALAVLVREGKGYFEGIEPRVTEARLTVERLILREAFKKTKTYRLMAIKSLGVILPILDVTPYEKVFGYLTEQSSLVGDDEEVEDKALDSKIRVEAFKALALTFPTLRNKEGQALYVDPVLAHLAMYLYREVWTIRTSILQSLLLLIPTFNPAIILLPSTSTALLKGLFECLKDLKYRNVREISGKVLLILTSLPDVKNELRNLKNVFGEIWKGERDVALQQNLAVIMALLD